MRVGITGSREAPTQQQVKLLRKYLSEATEVSHGCCLGFDAVAHYLAAKRGLSIRMYPPIVKTHRATLLPVTSKTHVLPEHDYIIRNEMIVDRCEQLIAGPRYGEGDKRSARSGTWQTIHMARKRGIPITIIYPDGSYAQESWPEDLDRT
jgi:hypothetical protein